MRTRGYIYPVSEGATGRLPGHASQRSQRSGAGTDVPRTVGPIRVVAARAGRGVAAAPRAVANTAPAPRVPAT